jgi:putative ABC transport system permease protein
MGRILLVGRLAVRDLRRRRIEAAPLLLALMAATTTLTLGLVLRDAASDPYQSTREATNGPDVVASVHQPAELSGLEELASAPASPTTADRTRSPRRNFRHPVERQMCRPWGATPRPRRSTSPS